MLILALWCGIAQRAPMCHDMRDSMCKRATHCNPNWKWSVNDNKNTKDGSGKGKQWGCCHGDELPGAWLLAKNVFLMCGRSL